HYVVGKPTLVMPTGGYGNYSLLGGTAPTATYGSTSQLGQLVSGNLNVNFGNGTVFVNIGTKFGTTAVNIVNQVGYISGSTFRGCSTNNYETNVVGIFTGTSAYRAGLVYSTQSGGPLGTVAGAAAFQRTGSNYFSTP
ncbi:MAG: hypothetical protein H7332_13105, partial [Bdellovibrionales bacterium]|nr:hypothetical protein [Ramlibacter sp.]